MANYFNYQDKNKDELIKELQKLQLDYDSLKTSYENDITKRRKVEEALKFTRLILDNAADTMAIIDYDGRFIDVNNAFCRSEGYSREQLLSMTVHDIDPLYPAATWSVFCEKLKQAGSLTFESVHHTKKGKFIPVEINVNYFEYKGKEYHCGIMRDITKRKQAEEALRLEKENFRHSLDDSPLGVRIVTMEGNTIYANQAIINIYGYESLEELKNTPLKERYTPESYVEAQERKRQRESGDLSATDYEISIVRKNGEIRHLQVFRNEILWDGVKQFQVIYKDISKRKQAEEALAQEQYLMHSLMDNLPDYIYFKDLESRFIRINKNHAQSFGLNDPALAVGKTDFDYFTEEHARQAYEDEQTIIRTGQMLSIEEKETHTDRPDTWVSTIKMPLLDKKGSIIGTFGISRDITEHKLAEDELKKNQTQLLNALKSAHLGSWEYYVEKDIFIFNDLFYAIFGTTAEQVGGYTMNFSDYENRFIHPEDRAVVRSKIKKSIEADDPNYSLQMEHRIIYADGKTGYMAVRTIIVKDEKGKTIKSYGVNQDITERMLAEEMLKESSQRVYEALEFNRKILHTSSIGILTYKKSGQCVSANRAIAKATGATVEQLLAQNFHEISSWKKSGKYQAAIKALDTGIEQLLDAHFVTTFGKDVWMSISFSSFDSAGERHLLVFAHDITERKQAEEEIRKSKKLLEDLYKHLTDIRENERAMISRDIHDQLGQSLTALKLDLNQMYKYVGINPEPIMKLNSMIELVSDTIKDVQRISSDLRPGILDDLGLISAIEWYCEEFEKRTGIKCNLELDSSNYIDSQKDLTFFRVLQEALTNVIRHANASSVTIKLHQTQKGTTLAIMDNGIGITRKKVESAKSLGLIGMRERVRQFGGKVGISSRKGQGTKLTIFIPMKKKSV